MSKTSHNIILVSILLFVDDRFFVSQKKSYEKSNINLFCSYSIMSSLFNQFGLVIEYDKSEVFYFLRSIKKHQSASSRSQTFREPFTPTK